MKYRINTTEDANKYHDMVHKFIEEYVVKWKISPKRLKEYLNPDSENYKSFLERTGLNEIENINVVVNNVIDDYCSAESDGIMTFESFASQEDIFKRISTPNIEYEKILADIFNTSLGYIEIANENYHHYKVTDFGKKSDVVILSKLDIQNIDDMILEYSLKNIKSQEFSVNSVGDVSISNPLKFPSIIISDDVFKKAYSDMMNSTILLGIIEDYLSQKLDCQCEHIREINGYHVWKLNIKNQGMV